MNTRERRVNTRGRERNTRGRRANTRGRERNTRGRRVNTRGRRVNTRGRERNTRTEQEYSRKERGILAEEREILAEERANTRGRERNTRGSYVDTDKAILNFANQSIFLVRSMNNQSSNFIDCYGKEQFSITFEVDGLSALETIHKIFKEKGIRVGEVENRGHAGRNFIFHDLEGNKFDVWSELSPTFIEKYKGEE